MSIRFAGHRALMEEEETTTEVVPPLSPSHSDTFKYQSGESPISIQIGDPSSHTDTSPNSVVLTLEQEKVPQPKIYKPLTHRIMVLLHEKEHQIHEVAYNPIARKQFILTYFGIKNILTCVVSIIGLLLLIGALVVGILLIPSQSSKISIGSFVWVSSPVSSSSLSEYHYKNYGNGGGIHTTSSFLNRLNRLNNLNKLNALNLGHSKLHSTNAVNAASGEIKLFNSYTEKVTDTIGTVDDTNEIVGSVVFGDSYYIFWKNKWEERSATNKKSNNWKGSEGTFTGTVYGFGYSNELKQWMVLMDKSGSKTNFVVKLQDGTEWQIPSMSNTVEFGRIAKHDDQIIVLATLSNGSQELYEIQYNTGTIQSITLNGYFLHALDDNRYATGNDSHFLAMGRLMTEKKTAGHIFGLNINSTAANITLTTYSHFIEIGDVYDKMSFYTFYSYEEENDGTTIKKPVQVVSVLAEENRLYALHAITGQVFADTTIDNVVSLGLNPNVKKE